jgi:hypothetical protein
MSSLFHSNESFFIFYLSKQSGQRWYSAGLRDRWSGVRVPTGAGNFFLHHRGTHQWAPGAVSLRVKRPGREADHSLPSSAEANNTWSYTSIPPSMPS